MKLLSFSEKCKVICGWFLVKIGKLHFDDFTEQELNALLAPFFPQTLDVDVPVGTAKLNCLEANLTLPITSNRICLSLFNDFEVVVLGNPLYRAHIVATLSAVPRYDKNSSQLDIVNITLDQLSLVQDEYTLVKDASYLLQQVSPLNIANALTSPLKRVLNTVTGGLTESATRYLKIFSKGNKQRLLDEHKPAIETAILAKLATLDLCVQMRPEIWREYLFSQLGQKVTVEDHRLRFWLSS